FYRLETKTTDPTEIRKKKCRKRKDREKEKLKLNLPLLWNPHKIKKNHSRRTDEVKRSADLPTAPFLFYASDGQSPPQ
ncbi:MAG: hypothetical protein ACTTKM_07965, partial [Prevotella fusca]